MSYTSAALNAEARCPPKLPRLIGSMVYYRSGSSRTFKMISFKEIKISSLSAALYGFHHGAEAAWQHNVTCDLERMSCNPIPICFGVSYDQWHTFGEHVRKLSQLIFCRYNLRRKVRGGNWGWLPWDRHPFYVAVMRSEREYAAASWGPWLSVITTSRVEGVQLEAIRTITLLVRSTPVKSVLVETQLPILRRISRPSPS